MTRTMQGQRSAKTFAALRQHFGFSDQRLGELAGYTLSQVEARRKGETPLTVDDMERFGAVFRVPCEVFLMEASAAIRWVIDNGIALEGISALALRYAHDRHAAGFLNDRSAEQTRARLASFVAFAPADPRQVRRHHVEQWMQQPHLSAAYRRARLSTLRMFCRWSVAHGFMVKDPTLAIDAPRVPDGIPKRLRPDEAQALMAAVAHDRRSHLVVSLMLQEGLRRIEISRLDVEDIDFAERSILIRSKGGHGAHVDILPVTSETWRILTRYLAEAGHQHGPLIRNRVRKHGRMAPQTISELVAAGMIAAGVKRPGDSSRTPHSCRHTAAHDMLARTKDVRSVQQALRHRSVRSTEIYLRGQVGELRLIMDGRSYTTGGDAA